jgi:hypothetical protein
MAGRILGSTWQQKFDKLTEEDRDLCCPVSLMVLTNPVLASDGFIYEEASLKQLLTNRQVSPLTRESLKQEYRPAWNKKAQAIAFRLERTQELLAFAAEAVAEHKQLALAALGRVEEYIVPLDPLVTDNLALQADNLYLRLGAPLKGAPLKRAPVAGSSPNIVAPKDCKVMMSFNMATAGDAAKELTQFLNAHGFPTFSTCVYCPATPGSDWKHSTNVGIATAKVLVTLITKGWLDSKECATETNTFQVLMNGDESKTIIPVNFPDITMTDYKDPMSCLFNMMTVQQIDGAKPNWMEDVLQGVRNAIQ